MKTSSITLTAVAALVLSRCATDSRQIEVAVPDFSAVSRVDSGTPVAIMLTVYSTTLLADGRDWTTLRVAVMDSLSREIATAADSIRIYVDGNGTITTLEGGALPLRTDTASVAYTPVQLVDGVATLAFHAGTSPEGGYAPGVGFCGLDSTLSMARRVKAAGMDLLLDFHYSDYWADPQQQNKPLAWAGLDYDRLRDSVRAYTAAVLRAMERQETSPDMVQIGNEVNHGLLWPDGHIGNLDQLAGLLRACVEGVEAVDPAMPVMMHLALHGQNDEARFWLDNMLARDVAFDVIGISYYPRWHGTLEDLYRNLHDLAERYHKPINVVEYSDFKREVHDIVFGLPDDLGTGTAIWEPLGWRSGLFDREGNVTDRIRIYDELSARYLRAS